MTLRVSRLSHSVTGVAAATIAIAALTVACGSSEGSSHQAEQSSPRSSLPPSADAVGKSPESGSVANVTVKTATNSLGTFLTDGSGKTLYLFTPDAHGKSSCEGDCSMEWPPMLTAGVPRADGGAKAGKMSTIKRDDGKVQVTYDGHPLYYFANDHKAGEVEGQGDDSKWYVLSPSGSPISKRLSESRRDNDKAGSDTDDNWS